MFATLFCYLNYSFSYFSVIVFFAAAHVPDGAQDPEGHHLQPGNNAAFFFTIVVHSLHVIAVLPFINCTSEFPL